MEYAVIMLAAMLFAAQFAFTKLFEKNMEQNIISTLTMMTVTGIIGAIIFLAANDFQLEISHLSLMWAVIFALVMIPYYMIGIKVLSIGSLAIYSMFMMLGGMLVPFFYGVIFLCETPSAAQIVGTVLLTGCVIMQAVCQGGDKDKSSQNSGKLLFFVLCLVIFFLNGMTGVIAKAHEISEGSVNEQSFTVMYCTLIAVISLFMLGISVVKSGKESFKSIKIAMKPRLLAIMAMIGVAAYGGNFLQLIAANKVDASVQFPMISGGVIVLSAIVSAVIFKEKISKKEWLSVVICTPKVRHFWRCIFLWQKRDKIKESTRQNSKSVL